MSEQKPAVYEFKHIKCSTDDVQAIIGQHQLFYWEVTGTNTVVSKESHLESGGIFDKDSIYSVTTEERFSTIDLKRDKTIDRLAEIKMIESQYFLLVAKLEQLDCSAYDNYSSPPPIHNDFSWFTFWILFCLWFVPGVIYWRNKNRKYAQLKEKYIAEWKSLKSQFDSLIDQNRELLNV